MVALTFSAGADAHPVPRGQHDRTIVVQLTPDPRARHVELNVHYRLEVDELTVVFDDMLPFLEEVQYDRYKNKMMEFYGEFTRIYAPMLANNLVARINGRPLKFQCIHRGHRRTDDDGTPLGHLRCDFVFSASFPMQPGDKGSLTFYESNYALQSGQVKLSWAFKEVRDIAQNDLATRWTLTARGWHARIENVKAPDSALQAKAILDLLPGEDELLRRVSFAFSWEPMALVGPVQHDEANPQSAPAAGKDATAPADAEAGDFDLFHLFLASDHGVVVLLLLSALIGAAHALTPGHGKTLVAAYLVGQRGTVGHAFVLGLVTTITHTGIVLLIALGLLFVNDESRQQVARTLGLGMGVALVCLGMWLLLQRLAGRADHFHLPGHGHHHHHHGEPPIHEGPSEAVTASVGRISNPSAVDGRIGNPSYDVATAVPPPNIRQPLRWTGLLIMGMTGGIAPCWDAVAMLVMAIGMNLLTLALPMLLAFSAGLASVLVLIGVLVVHARKLLDARWSDSRAIRLLPIVSAAFIAGMGVLVCYQGVQGEFHGNHQTPAAKTSRP